jgi:hypothetical protein
VFGSVDWTPRCGIRGTLVLRGTTGVWKVYLELTELNYDYTGFRGFRLILGSLRCNERCVAGCLQFF